MAAPKKRETLLSHRSARVQAVIVKEITFDQSRKVRLVVEIPETESYLTSHAPNMPRILFRMFPYLAAQRCYNDKGHSFRREALSTEIPHLFEHLLLEIQKQVRLSGQGEGPITGDTQWNWSVDPRGRFHVTVSYDNEIVALASIRLAERIINSLDNKEIAQIDIDREMRRLRDLARISRRFIPPAKRNGGAAAEELDEDDVLLADAQENIADEAIVRDVEEISLFPKRLAG